MASNILKISALAFLAYASVLSAAQAGGFARGTADTDILFEEGNFNIRAGATIVNPTRKYTVNNRAALIGTSYTDTYAIPSAAIKLNVNDDLRCAGTFVNAYGGAGTWVVPTMTGKTSEQFEVNEGALTCGYKFALSKGQVWFLGGVFAEMFDYSQSKVSPLGPVQLDLTGTAVGFRIGAAYEIPEIALRAQLMYRGGTSYGASGTLTAPLGALDPVNFPGNTTQVPVSALGTGNMPQSVELKLQSGVAPGWLAFGSVKWTDWSVLDTLDVTRASDGAMLSQNKYYWNDGWTVSAGIGHAFTEKWSGAASITWDRGVKSGWDLSSDTWTFGAGASYKDDMGGELKFGGGITYIASAAETKYTVPEGGNTAVGAGWAYAIGGSYKTKW